MIESLLRANMTISVVIPTYNGEKYVEQAIKSVLNQTRPADEIIVSDDNSSDATLEICNGYSDRIKIFKNPSGPSGFVNGWKNAIRYASCEFVSILHQDDLLAPTFLAEVEAAHKMHPDVDHIVSCCNYINERGEEIRKSSYLNDKIERMSGMQYSDIYILNSFDHINRCPGVVDRKKLYLKCNYRSEAGHIADDDFFIRVGNFTDIVCIHKPLAFYREHFGSETGHLEKIQLDLRLLRDYGFQIKQFKYNHTLSQEAKRQFRAGEGCFFRRVFITSLKRMRFRFTLQSIKYLILATIRDKGGNIPYIFKRF